MKKLLSIAIPFYNGFETIVSILNELAESNDLNYEIIISDVCSEAQQSDKLLNFIQDNNHNQNMNLPVKARFTLEDICYSEKYGNQIKSNSL